MAEHSSSYRQARRVSVLKHVQEVNCNAHPAAICFVESCLYICA